MNNGRIRKVAIIGAGVAGLASARSLTKKGIHCTVYDRQHKVGGVWADGYVGFGVQVQKDLYEFPDHPLPKNAENFTSGSAFQEYLETYVDAHGLRECLKLGVEVQSVSRDPEGGWTLTVRHDGESREDEADYLVVATGLYSETADLPEVPEKDKFNGKIFHSSEIKDFEQLRDRDVVVIGYGKSAADIATGAVAEAKSVRLVFRAAHWPVPRKLLGILPFKWGMLTRLVASLIPPYVRPTPAVRLLHSIGKPLPWLFWRVVEILLRTQQKLGTRTENGMNLVPDQDILTDAYSERTMVPRPELITLIRNRKIRAHRNGVSRFTKDGLILDDGTELSTDCIVFGTGWKNAYGFLPETIKETLGEEDDGIYLYRHILHPAVPDMAFVGKVATFMSVTSYALQARWLAESISGNIASPPAEDMNRAIGDLKAWKRSWMPASPARSGTLLLHMAHYHDELLSDLGEDPLRKRGLLAPLKELLVPYHASDFKNIT